MSVTYTFRCEEKFDDAPHVRTEIVVEHAEDITWGKLLNQFNHFLRASGFVYDHLATVELADNSGNVMKKIGVNF